MKANWFAILGATMFAWCAIYHTPLKSQLVFGREAILNDLIEPDKNYIKNNKKKLKINVIKESRTWFRILNKYFVKVTLEPVFENVLLHQWSSPQSKE
jgi:hypothetical protein